MVNEEIKKNPLINRYFLDGEEVELGENINYLDASINYRIYSYR